MNIEALTIKRLHIPFKRRFRHASAIRSVTTSVWVEARSKSGAVGYGESCPREYVTGESPTSAMTFLGTHRRPIVALIKDFASLRKWMRDHRSAIDQNPAAWCAIELALLDLMAKENGCSVESLLSHPKLTGEFQYTAVIGDDEPRDVELLLARYLSAGFSDFKIKLSGDEDRDAAKLQLLEKRLGRSTRVRADANNLWERCDQAVHFIRNLEFPLWALEEPLKPGRYKMLSTISKSLGAKIILDESFLNRQQFRFLRGAPDNWLINLRISKMGGVLRSLDIVDEARERGIGIILGAHVGETSLLSRAALTVANSCRDILIVQEGACGTHLLKYDPCRPEIMFGARGIVQAEQVMLPEAVGFGLEVRTDPPRWVE